MAIDLDDLARLAFSGDAGAWRQLYDAATPRLFGLVRRMGAGLDDAAEIVQETWLRIIRYQEKFDQSRRFEAFVFTVAARIWIDACRRRRTKPPTAVLPEDVMADVPAPLDNLFAVEQTERMMQCLSHLSEPEREVLMLRFWESLSHREVGERIGTTTESAKGKTFRAVRKLADCMHLEDFDEFSPPTASVRSDAT